MIDFSLIATFRLQILFFTKLSMSSLRYLGLNLSLITFYHKTQKKSQKQQSVSHTLQDYTHYSTSAIIRGSVNE